MDVISDRIDINVLKTTLSTYSPVSGHIKIILETVIYRGEKSLLVLIYSSDSYNLGALEISMISWDKIQVISKTYVHDKID